MQFIIDGNNLAHAYAEVAGPTIGRQHLCEVIGRWAARSQATAVIVFDGPPPAPGVRRQMEHDALDILLRHRPLPAGLRQAALDLVPVEGLAIPTFLHDGEQLPLDPFVGGEPLLAPETLAPASDEVPVVSGP